MKKEIISTLVLLTLVFNANLFGQTYELYKTFHGHTDEVTALSFRAEDNLLVSGSKNGEIIIRNIENNDTFLINAHTKEISDLNFANKNNWLVSAGYEGKIKIWDLSTRTLKNTFENPAIPPYGKAPNVINGNEPTFAVFNANDKSIYFGGYNGKVVKGNLQQNTTSVLYEDKKGGITCGLINRNNLVFAATKNLYFMDLDTKDVIKTIKKSEDIQDYVCEMAFVPEKSDQIAYWGNNGRVNIMNNETGRIENEIIASSNQGASNIAFSWDGQLLLTGNEGSKVKIWDTNTNTVQQVLEGHNAEVTNFAITADAYYIVTGSKDKTVRVWKKKIEEEDLSHIPDTLNGRPVELDETETVKVENPNVQLLVWDNQREDGDIISVNLNGRWILENFELSRHKHPINVKMQRGENYLILFAHNEGDEPPNTASVAVKDGDEEKKLTLKSSLTTNAALNIIYEP